MKDFDVIIIGAGAAGLLAAGRTAECGGSVLILEKMRREGQKLLITGKGRCNITNNAPLSEFIKHVYPNVKAIWLCKYFSVFFDIFYKIFKQLIHVLWHIGL